MIKYAIVGNIASGKSTVEKILKNKGFKVFDTDEIAHKILENSADVKTAFKDYDIFTDNKIDRKKLANIVFNNKKELKKLEEIIHPLVKIEILKIFEENYSEVFISVPQLFEAGFENLFDKIIFLTANEDIRIERLIKRNNYTKEQALARIKAQSNSGKIEHSDYVIENNGTIEELCEKLDRIFAV
jgi:dephospho-CoA kinase